MRISPRGDVRNHTDVRIAMLMLREQTQMVHQNESMAARMATPRSSVMASIPMGISVAYLQLSRIVRGCIFAQC